MIPPPSIAKRDVDSRQPSPSLAARRRRPPAASLPPLHKSQQTCRILRNLLQLVTVWNGLSYGHCGWDLSADAACEWVCWSGWHVDRICERGSCGVERSSWALAPPVKYNHLMLSLHEGLQRCAFGHFNHNRSRRFWELEGTVRPGRGFRSIADTHTSGWSGSWQTDFVANFTRRLCGVGGRALTMGPSAPLRPLLHY